MTTNIEELKELGEISIPLIPEKYKNDKSKHGVFSFKYQSKNVALPEKKVEPVKKE